MKARRATIIGTTLLAAGRWFVTIVLLCAAAVRAAEPTFTNVTATVAPGLLELRSSSTVAWGDYDNDGRLDFFIAGAFYDGDNDVYYSQIWRNTGSDFTNVTPTVAPGLPGIYKGSAAWGDFDNDGRLDLLLTGTVGLENGIAQIRWNSETGFVRVTGLPAVDGGLVAWGDYDNDGRLDFLLSGFYGGDEDGTNITQLWRNTGSGFTNVTTTALPGLPQSGHRSMAWGDYDNDGWLDFLIIGHPVSELWRNTGNGFTNVTATVAPGLLGVTGGVVAWGDYDNDGRLDFFLTGSGIWRNTGSNFVNVTATVAPGLLGVGGDTVAWGDYDNDGRLDFFIAASFYVGNDFVYYSQIWRNTGTGFTNVTATVAPDLLDVCCIRSVAWGDYDNDGRLDLLMSGGPLDLLLGASPPQIFRNTTPITNMPPSAPTGLAMTASSNAVMLSWNSATDGHTPASGLTYNVRAGTTPGGNDLLSAHVNATNGFRRVPAMGNAMLRHSLPLTGLTNGQTVYWSVQAVDSAFAGGPFAAETNTVLLPQLFVNVTATIAPGLPYGCSTVAWGDYDNDGRLDFLLAGFSKSSIFDLSGVFYSQLWRNTGTGFTNVADALAPAMTASYPISSSVSWGDYNNDGRLDFLLSGHCAPSGGTGFVSQLWQNAGTGFTDVTASAGLPQFSSAAWVDFDNDGRLDLFFTGFPLGFWRNNTPITNTPPSAPTGLAMTASSNAVMLSWNSAADDHTPASGLTYNVRAGTTPGANNLLSAHVNATNGFRRVPAMGNAMLRHSLPLTGLTNGQTVYWSVQAVDTSFAGGPFATETSVVSIPQLAITPLSSSNAIVSWAPPTFGWFLQQSTNLSTSNWTTAPSGSANPASVPATNETRFYRLANP